MKKIWRSYELILGNLDELVQCLDENCDFKVWSETNWRPGLKRIHNGEQTYRDYATVYTSLTVYKVGVLAPSKIHSLIQSKFKNNNERYVKQVQEGKGEWKVYG